MRGRLFVLAGPEIGRSYELRHGDTLGRSPDCIVTLRHASVSRRHAHIEVRDDAFWVVDDGSRNGVYLSGGRVRTLKLVDHMEFSLGELALRFRLESAGERRSQTAEDPGGGQANGQAAPRGAHPTIPPLHPGTGPNAAGDDPPPNSPGAASRTPTLDARPPTPNAPPSAPGARPPAPDARPPGSDAAPPQPDDGGITLEAPEEIELAPASAPPARSSRATPPPKSSGERVLQYHRVPNERGFAVADLSQQPLWLRGLLYALAAALAAGLCYAAFKGTAYLKGRAASAPADLDGADSR